jgi:ABC-type multidrug transport system fused ATPase/permease subunit
MLRKLLAVMDRRDRLELWLLLVVMIVVAFVEMAGVASIMPFMAVVANPEVIHTNRLLSTAYEGLGFDSERVFLIFTGLLAFGLLVFSNVVKAASYWLAQRYDNRLYCTLARRLLSNYMARPYVFFLGRNTAELGKNILHEVSIVIGGVLSPCKIILSSSLVCIAIMVLLIIVNPLVALAIVIVLGSSYATIYFMVRRKLKTIGEQQVQAAAEKFKNATEALSGIKEIKILGREPTFLGRFSFYAERHSRNNVAATLIGELPRYALESIAFGGILLVVLYFLAQGQQAVQMVPLLALYALAGYRLMPAIQQLFSAFATLRANVPALDVLYRDLAPNPHDPTDPEARLQASAVARPLPFERALELSDVSFHYQGAAKPSLNNLNLVIKPNTSVGLVGPTGCGKTTTVDLVLGLLSPSTGQILVDGIEITANNQANWQKNLGYVPQQIYISDDTVARNIAFGVPDDEIDMAAVCKAAAIANLAEFVESELPEGYETGIGERGVRLSGGQRQRIGIARAMYRNPAILVMDEATSALDGITEEAVMDAVRNLSKRTTIILIAHRLTTVKECDVIYQLEQGAIIAQGTFHDLMRDSHWFRKAARG